jgi:aldehyde:ferredoxin oxidoreductase
MNGYCGSILRVDLTSGGISEDPLSLNQAKAYIGGRGLSISHLFKELPPAVDPLSKENRVYIFSGPICGTAVPYSSRYTLVTKSPLTQTYTRTLSGGQFSAALKYAGYDGLIIEGKAQQPCYLVLEGNQAKLLDASHLWGMTSRATEEWLRHNHPGLKSLCIGPAGEKGVAFACVLNDWGRAAGRGGVGAVLGSKNLKAICVSGNKGVQVAKKETFLSTLKDVYKQVDDHPQLRERIRVGTTMTVKSTHETGVIPIRNYSGQPLADAENLYPDVFRKQLVVHDESCFSCPLPCGKMAMVRSGKYKGTVVQGPQFETIGMLGSNCGITDLNVVAHANSLCNDYGLDTIETGNVIAFAMECYERGFLTSRDTGGIALNFGNPDALIHAIEAIGTQTGMGSLLGLGAAGAAKQIGQNSESFAMASKGQGFASFDPRALVGMGLIYASAPTGANHSTGPTLGGEKPLGLTSHQKKPQLVLTNQNNYCFVDSLVMCSFSRYGLDNPLRLSLLEDVTGLSYDLDQITNRIFTLERLFNLREGFGRAHDTLPGRSLNEPMPTGPAQGSTVNIDRLLDEYYALRGWDAKGVPTISCLQRYGLEEQLQELQQMGLSFTD